MKKYDRKINEKCDTKLLRYDTKKNRIVPLNPMN